MFKHMILFKQAAFLYWSEPIRLELVTAVHVQAISCPILVRTNRKWVVTAVFMLSTLVEPIG